MQHYECKHCGIDAKTIEEIMLHLFTDHQHVDIGLDKEKAKELMKGMEVLTPEMIQVGRN